jgi:hypothetical protein
MDIQGMHEFINDLKNQGQGGYFSPEQIDRALNAASSDKFNEEKRQFELTQSISDDLNPFQKFGTVTLTSGLGDLPADYDYATNAATISVTAALNNLPIDIVRDGEWVNRINDPISVPSAEKPVLIIRNQIEVVPSSLASFRLYYLRRPVAVVFGYTESDGDYIYSSGSSTDSDWPESCHVDLCLRALVYLGVILDNDTLIRLKAYKKQTENV